MGTTEHETATALRELTKILSDDYFSHKNPRPGIMRIDDSYRSTYGWMVRIQRSGKRYSKFFSDGAIDSWDRFKIKRKLANQLGVSVHNVPQHEFTAAWREEKVRRRAGSYALAQFWLREMKEKLGDPLPGSPHQRKKRGRAVYPGVVPIIKIRTRMVEKDVVRYGYGKSYQTSSSSDYLTIDSSTAGDIVVVSARAGKEMVEEKYEEFMGYTVSWQENGKQRRKRFTVKEHGDLTNALHRAYRYRLEKEVLMRLAWKKKHNIH